MEAKNKSVVSTQQEYGAYVIVLNIASCFEYYNTECVTYVKLNSFVLKSSAKECKNY